MSSFDHSLAAITDRRANLNVQLCELNLLRERVRKAELASRRSLYRRKKRAFGGLNLEAAYAAAKSIRKSSICFPAVSQRWLLPATCPSLGRLGLSGFHCAVTASHYRARTG
jgi:hypothetical protein